MGKRGRKPRAASQAGARHVINVMRSAKARARGRVWDILHMAESMLTRAVEGRASTFKRRKPAGKGGKK